MRLRVTLSAIILAIGVTAFAPPPDDEPTGLRGGAKSRKLSMANPESAQQPPSADSKRSLFMDVPDPQPGAAPKDGGKRTLFMDVPEPDVKPQVVSGGGKRSLAIEAEGMASDVSEELPAGGFKLFQAIDAHLPLFAFPGLKSRNFQSEQLIAKGHDNIVSRLLMLAEMGEVHEREKAQERDQWEHAFTKQYGQDDVPDRWRR